MSFIVIKFTKFTKLLIMKFTKFTKLLIMKLIMEQTDDNKDLIFICCNFPIAIFAPKNKSYMLRKNCAYKKSKVA